MYIKAVMADEAFFEFENLMPRDVLNEYIMTSLRATEGLDLQYVTKHFGVQKGDFLESNATIYIHSNQMEKKQGRLILTKNGKLFADGIASALFFD